MVTSNRVYRMEKRADLVYDTVGFPLDRYIYPDDLKPGFYRSVLGQIIADEEKRSGLKAVLKTQGWNRLLSVLRAKVADRFWQGCLNEHQDEQRHYCLACGKYGVREQNEKGETRDRVYHCNQLRRCPVCNVRYHDGKSYERTRIVAAVMRANNLRQVRKFQLTLPDFLWKLFQNPKELRVLKRAANKMLQELYGCPMNHMRAYENGSVGIHIQAHLHSSQEAHKIEPHLHTYVVPIMVNGGKVKNVDRILGVADLKAMRRQWAKAVKLVCEELGYKEAAEIPDELVIHHDYKKLPESGAAESSKVFNFRYDQRSPVEDLLKAIKAVDFDQELTIMAFSQAGYRYFAVWRFDDLVEQILERLALKETNTTYGWLRRFRACAEILGVEVERKEDDFNPVKDLEVKTVYRRKYEVKYNKAKDIFRQIKRVFVKDLSDPDKPEFWREVAPWDVQGEQFWMPCKVQYKYRVPLQPGVGDRGS